jgi:hypothetical protein
MGLHIVLMQELPVGPVVDDNRGGDFAASGTRWLACGMPDEGKTSARGKALGVDETRETVSEGRRHTARPAQSMLCLVVYE